MMGIKRNCSKPYFVIVFFGNMTSIESSLYFSRKYQSCNPKVCFKFCICLDCNLKYVYYITVIYDQNLSMYNAKVQIT